ncbi:MAG: signal peptidase I [Halapricum sp.]
MISARTLAWRLLHVVAVLMLVAVVVPFVVYGFPGLVGADHSFVVLSGSMEPTFGAGDAILIDGVDPATIEAGDIVAFTTESGSIPTVHRVVGVVDTEYGRAFQTKGDGNDAPDQALVRPGQVVGRIPTVGGSLLVVPLIGHVILFVGTPEGFLALVGVPFVLLVLGELWSVVRAARAGPADGDDSTPEPSSGDEFVAAPPTGMGTVSLSRESLVLVVPVLGAFALYAGWTALALRSGFAFTLAAATTVLFVLGVGLVALARWSAGAEVAGPPAVPAEPIRIEVESLPALLALADAQDCTLVWDHNRGELATVEGTLTFVAPVAWPGGTGLETLVVSPTTRPAETDGGVGNLGPAGSPATDAGGGDRS